MNVHTRIDQSQIKNLIRENGCFSEEVNLKIYENWFRRPRRSFLAVLRHFLREDQVLCDIGCGYGNNLFYCTPNSYGIDVKKSAVDFARSIGLTVYQRNLFSELSDLPKVDVIWCADVLEHVESPHIFLRKLSQLLKDKGILIIKIPTIPHYRIPLPILKKYQSGYLAADHINGFTCATLRFSCERGGFKTILAGPFVSPGLRWLNRIPWISENIGQALYIGSKIPHWQYPQRAMRIATENGPGFVYKQQFDMGKYANSRL